MASVEWILRQPPALKKRPWWNKGQRLLSTQNPCRLLFWDRLHYLRIGMKSWEVVHKRKRWCCWFSQAKECAVLWKKSKMWHVFQLMIILIDSCFILYLKEDKYSSSEWMDCTTLIPWTDPSEFDMNWKLGVIYFCSPSPLKRRPETVVNTPTKPFFL